METAWILPPLAAVPCSLGRRWAKLCGCDQNLSAGSQRQRPCDRLIYLFANAKRSVWDYLRKSPPIHERRTLFGCPACHLIGGGAIDGGTGFPSAVFGSINSIRVPSGSKRFACRFPFLPTLISIGLA